MLGPTESVNKVNKPCFRNKIKLARCIGYYDRFKTVSFSDIDVCGGSPEIIELNEFTHSDLSESSVVGNMFHYFPRARSHRSLESGTDGIVISEGQRVLENLS